MQERGRARVIKLADNTVAIRSQSVNSRRCNRIFRACGSTEGISMAPIRVIPSDWSQLTNDWCAAMRWRRTFYARCYSFTLFTRIIPESDCLSHLLHDDAPWIRSLFLKYDYAKDFTQRQYFRSDKMFYLRLNLKICFTMHTILQNCRFYIISFDINFTFNIQLSIYIWLIYCFECSWFSFEKYRLFSFSYATSRNIIKCAYQKSVSDAKHKWYNENEMHFSENIDKIKTAECNCFLMNCKFTVIIN